LTNHPKSSIIDIENNTEELITMTIRIMVTKGTQSMIMPVTFPSESVAEYAIEWYKRAPEFSGCIFRIVVEA
jgi:hypothetical protein